MLFKLNFFSYEEPFDEFLRNEKLVEKLNKVDQFTRSRVPGTSEASEAAIIASLTPQDLIDRKLYSTKLASLSKLEQYAQKVNKYLLIITFNLCLVGNGKFSIVIEIEQSTN